MGHTMNLEHSTIVVFDSSRVKGGKRTKTRVVRNEREDQRQEIDKESETVIENVSERTEGEAIRAKATHAIRSRAQMTPIGYVLTPDRKVDLLDAMDQVAREAQEFNDRATTCQVEIKGLFLPIEIPLGSDVAKAIADHVKGELMAMRDALGKGEIATTRNVILRAKNLDTLATGAQRDAIVFALQNATDALYTLKSRTKDQGNGVSESPESVAKGLDLAMLNAAIGMFEY